MLGSRRVYFAFLCYSRSSNTIVLQVQVLSYTERNLQQHKMHDEFNFPGAACDNPRAHTIIHLPPKVICSWQQGQ